MAKKQTRRTISLSEQHYQKLEAIGIEQDLPKAAALTRLIEAWLKNTPSGRSKSKNGTEVPPPPSASNKPSYVVNTDLYVEASSPEEAEAKIKALMERNKVNYLVLSSDAE